MRFGLHRLVVTAFILVACCSLGVGLRDVMPLLSGTTQAWKNVSPHDAERAVAERWGFDADAFDLYRSEVRSRDRFYFDAPAGSQFGGLTTGQAARAYAIYWLAPAIPVDKPSEATVVLTYGADLQGLGLTYQSVTRLPGRPDFAVGRLSG